MNNQCTWHFQLSGVRWVNGGQGGGEVTFPSWRICCFMAGDCSTRVSHLARECPCWAAKTPNTAVSYLWWSPWLAARECLRLMVTAQGAAWGWGTASAPPGLPLPAFSIKAPLEPPSSQCGSPQRVPAGQHCLGVCSAAQNHAVIILGEHYSCSGWTDCTETWWAPSLAGSRSWQGRAGSLFITHPDKVTLQAPHSHLHNRLTPRKGQWHGKAIAF